jgi:transcriptional regulator with XRE-family HTH domain
VPTVSITRLKMLLLDADQPQYQVAAKCGIHPSTLSDYALGKEPSVDHLRALCKYFKCRQQDILGWVEVEWEVPDEA